ncbi:MAG: transglutaminase protein [Acidobacteriaceae bacterium]|nr:transglutaminase protein [Acidobacteriaceae bacterium]
MFNWRTVLFLFWLLGSAFGAQPRIPDWMRQAAAEPVTFDKEAEAAVLLDEQVVTVLLDGQVETMHRRVIKILRPQGSDYANLYSRFDKDRQILSLHAWSLSSKGAEYELKPKDFSETGYSEELYSDIHVKFARAAAADPGTIIGLEEVHRSRTYLPEEIWDFQETIPVHIARYTVQLPSGWEYKAMYFRHPVVQPATSGVNNFTWNIKDVPGIESQPSMPPESALAARMTLAYYGPQESFRFGSWDNIGRWYANLSKDRRNNSVQIEERAHQLTAGLPGTFDKAAALASFLQKKIRYVAIEIGIGGYQPHFATDVYRNGYGDCKDKATLLSSLLHDVGVSSQLVLVHTNRGTVVPDAPSAYFNHAILAVEWPASESLDPRVHSMVTSKSGRRWVIFDPTDEYTPFGDIGNHLESNYVLVSGDTGGELVQLPLSKPERNEFRRTGKLKLQEDGSLSGEIEELRTGDLAWTQRAHILGRSDDQRKKEIEGFLARYFSGFVLENLKIENLGETEKDLVIRYNFTARNYSRNMGALILVRPGVLGEHFKEVGDEPRKYPVHYAFASHHSDSFSIELPGDYSVDELPQPAVAEMGFASYSSKSEVRSNILTYSRDYTVREVSVDASRVEEVKRLNRIMAADQRSNAVFKKMQ